MTHKIILGDLRRLLFPEDYPFFTNHFKEELALVSESGLTDLSFQNISFKSKVSKYSLMVKDEETRLFLRYVFDRYVEDFFDWRREYNWYELKLILFHFLVFSNCKSSNQFYKLFKNKKLQRIFKKYFPQHTNNASNPCLDNKDSLQQNA